MIGKAIVIVVSAGLIIMACGGARSDLSQLSEGERTYRTKCGNCHRLQKPESHTSEEWGIILEKHRDRSKLSDSALAVISGFLISENEAAATSN